MVNDPWYKGERGGKALFLKGRKSLEWQPSLIPDHHSVDEVKEDIAMNGNQSTQDLGNSIDNV
jgi:hypothetical protein